MDAIVLAGGLGTRLRSLVNDVPKPMAPVAGRPFLEHLLKYWMAQGVRRFVISVGYLADRLIGHFGEVWSGADIAYAREQAPLGTGGGLLLALDQVRSSNVLVLNGDTFFAVRLEALAAIHAAQRADCTIALFRSMDIQRYQGVELASDGRITKLGTSNSGSAAVNGGVYIFRTASLRALPWRSGQPASLEKDFLPWGLANGWAVRGIESQASFIDIGLPEDYRRASTVLAL